MLALYMPDSPTDPQTGSRQPQVRADGRGFGCLYGYGDGYNFYYGKGATTADPKDRLPWSITC